MYEYREGLEVVVPPFTADPNQINQMLFLISRVLDQVAVEPGHVVVRGTFAGCKDEWVIRLPLGLRPASQGVVYGLHQHLPPGGARGYVLGFQAASRYAGFR